MISRYRLSTQHQIERLVIERMRLGVAEPAARGDSYAALAVVAKQIGWSILPPDAPFLSEDEVIILGCLARRQRQWHGIVSELPAALAVEMDRCAADLKVRGFRLPYISVQRLGFTEEALLRNKTIPSNSAPQPREARRHWRSAAAQRGLPTSRPR